MDWVWFVCTGVFPQKNPGAKSGFSLLAFSPSILWSLLAAPLPIDFTGRQNPSPFRLHSRNFPQREKTGENEPTLPTATTAAPSANSSIEERAAMQEVK